MDKFSQFQVEPLYDEDSCDPCAFYAEGRIDKKEFAIRCNKEFDLAEFETPVHVENVYYMWKQKVHNSGDYEFFLISSEEGQEGAFLATYTEL